MQFDIKTDGIPRKVVEKLKAFAGGEVAGDAQALDPLDGDTDGDLLFAVTMGALRVNNHAAALVLRDILINTGYPLHEHLRPLDGDATKFLYAPSLLRDATTPRQARADALSLGAAFFRDGDFERADQFVSLHLTLSEWQHTYWPLKDGVRLSSLDIHPLVERRQRYWMDVSAPVMNTPIAPFVDLLVEVSDSERPIVVDIGCGSGELLAAFRDRMRGRGTYVGVEPHAESARLAAENHALTVHVSRIEDVLPTLPEADLVLLNGVVQFFTPDELATLFARLRPVARRVAIGDDVLNMNDVAIHRGSHLFAQPLHSLLEKAGFQIERSAPNPGPCRAVNGFIIARRVPAP